MYSHSVSLKFDVPFSSYSTLELQSRLFLFRYSDYMFAYISDNSHLHYIFSPSHLPRYSYLNDIRHPPFAFLEGNIVEKNLFRLRRQLLDCVSVAAMCMQWTPSQSVSPSLCTGIVTRVRNYGRFSATTIARQTCIRLWCDVFIHAFVMETSFRAPTFIYNGL
jgi:hypothetical protein